MALVNLIETCYHSVERIIRVFIYVNVYGFIAYFATVVSLSVASLMLTVFIDICLFLLYQF